MSAAEARRGAPSPSFGPSPDRRVNIVQGERHVSGDPAVVVATLLGSCVAACLRDPTCGVGGMNHFLLPGDQAHVETDRLGFGVHAMELLVNDLLVAGAQRNRLEAKLFGGAHLMDGLADVGRQNSDFARAFLDAERIRYLGGSLGGSAARRVQFWPSSGRARQFVARQDGELVFAQEIGRTSVFTSLTRGCGAVELF